MLADCRPFFHMSRPKQYLTPSTLLGGASVAIAIYIVVVVSMYVSNLGSLPFSKSDPAPWGQFGDYVGGLLNPVFALANVALVAYIALSVQKLSDLERRNEQESAQRVQTTIDLHKEWNSASLYGSRTLSSRIVRSHSELSIFEIEKMVAYEQAAHIWIVIGFFQRLSFFVQHDKAHKEMVVELFGELFVWWWTVCYETQLMPCDCDARGRIFVLKDWVYENTTEAQRLPWIHRARQRLGEPVEAALASV